MTPDDTQICSKVFWPKDWKIFVPRMFLPGLGSRGRRPSWTEDRARKPGTRVQRVFDAFGVGFEVMNGMNMQQLASIVFPQAVWYGNCKGFARVPPTPFQEECSACN